MRFSLLALALAPLLAAVAAAPIEVPPADLKHFHIGTTVLHEPQVVRRQLSTVFEDLVEDIAGKAGKTAKNTKQKAKAADENQTSSDNDDCLAAKTCVAIPGGVSVA